MRNFWKGVLEGLGLVMLFSAIFFWLHVLGAVDPVPGAAELLSRP